MSHAVIPVYRPTQYEYDKVFCSALFGGAPKTDVPPSLELAGYWAATDDTPTKNKVVEWKPEMKFATYIRGVMRDKRRSRQIDRILAKRARQEVL